jgi:hypothetical protein
MKAPDGRIDVRHRKATVEQAEGIRQVTGAMFSVSDMVQHTHRDQEQNKGRADNEGSRR